MTSELNPCPFCGGKPHGAEPEVNINYVGCTECQACVPNDAVWNTRRAQCDELETVSWTNKAQLSFLKDPEWNAAPMAMWTKEYIVWSSTDIALVTRQNAEEVIAAKDARIAELENAIKVKGGNEHSPTQDAYDLACQAIEKHRDRADALEANNKRLREALETILNKCTSFEHINLVGKKTSKEKRAGTLRNVMLIARAALGELKL